MNNKNEIIVALAGNPNTGKSTVFNNLTGLKQHTGNWSGKTVVNAEGGFKVENINFRIFDLPGIYSLLSDSAEEKEAKDFICFDKPDITIVVLDSTCLERNLNLALQVMEITDNVIICLNLMDEANRKNIKIDPHMLEEITGVPVICASARQGEGIPQLKDMLVKIVKGTRKIKPNKTKFDEDIENSINLVMSKSIHLIPQGFDRKWIASLVIEEDNCIYGKYADNAGLDNYELIELYSYGKWAREELSKKGLTKEDFKVKKSLTMIKRAEITAGKVVTESCGAKDGKERKIDKIILSKTFGIPIMLGILAIIFWITIIGANYPSSLLMKLFGIMEERIGVLLLGINTPHWLYSLLVEGIFRTVSWVVAVMLPPMAIFFPMFTFLEDVGLLPRIAFNLDGLFKRAGAHGKQALTMCMGFGCNAAGITSCKIIETPRERLIAILTNNFVPCNGRFPTIIMLAVIFFSGSSAGGLKSGIFVLIVIIFSVLVTLLISKLLSATILKGVSSSSFTLELPPYRKPQLGKIIVRSIVDRTIFVLGRAITVAIPAGAIIWVLQNVYIGDMTIIAQLSAVLDPFAQVIGLDGIILMAFILGIPANEIVIPIIIMCYSGNGVLMHMENTYEIGRIFMANGWTWLTALCTVIFSLNHFPCTTALLTIKKETKSWKWTGAAFIIPTLVGLLLCFIVAQTVKIFGLI